MKLISYKSRLLLTAALLATAGPAAAVDPCIVGTWEADYLVFGEQLMNSMDASSVQMTGEVFMTVADTGIGTYLVDQLNLMIQLPDVPRTDVLMNGTAEFTTENPEDGQFHLDMVDFLYETTVTVQLPGMPMVIDVPFDETQYPFGAAAGLYTCTAEVLELDALSNTSVIRRWNRYGDGA